MSRLVIDVTSEQHKQIKALAAMSGKTIKQYILDKVTENKLSDEDAALQELKVLLDKRIASAEAGNISKKSMLDIAKAKAKEFKQ